MTTIAPMLPALTSNMIATIIFLKQNLTTRANTHFPIINHFLNINVFVIFFNELLTCFIRVTFVRIIKIEAIHLLAFFALGILIFIKLKYIIAFIAWTVPYNLLIIHYKFILMLFEKSFKIETFCDFPQIFVCNLILLLWAKLALTFR
jgi:hypothetical protein